MRDKTPHSRIIAHFPAFGIILTLPIPGITSVIPSLEMIAILTRINQNIQIMPILFNIPISPIKSLCPSMRLFN